jgi:glucose-6-phosphate isomerase
MALRGDEHVTVDGHDVLPEVQRNRERMRVVAQAVREGQWKGHTGERIRSVLALGIGGSALGPRVALEALRGEADGPEVRFVTNVDGAEFDDAVDGLDPASTLVVVASKTFTTQETMSNAQAAKRWGARHFFAVTSNVEEAKKLGAEEILPMWDWVGGRFSVWSAVGLAAACAMGFEAFEEFLRGGHEIDRHFAEAPLEKNVPALMALIGVWNTNFLHTPTHVVLPYSNALRLLPMFLQQLEMESNGKRVDREGRFVDYATVPVVWGGEGTVTQHSFHQQLHQGTHAVAADFLDFDLEKNLSANARAQADTILAADPQHLFGLFGAAQVEQQRGNGDAAKGLYQRFLDAYATQVERNLPEYQEHAQGLPSMRAEAQQAVGQAR